MLLFKTVCVLLALWPSCFSLLPRRIEEKGDGSAEVEVDPDAEYDEDEEGVPFVDEEKEEEGDELVEDEGEEEVEEEVEEVVRMPVPVGVGGGVEHFTNLTISKNKKSRGMKALVSKKKRRFVQVKI